MVTSTARSSLLADVPALRDSRRAALVDLVCTAAAPTMGVVTTPMTEEPIGEVPVCQPDDVVEAVRRVREAQPAWAARSFAERAAVLRRFRDLVLDRQEEVLDLVQLEAGKTRAHALEEVLDCALVAGYYARSGRWHLADVRRDGALPVLTRTVEIRRPKGVVGFIAPWNYPLSMAVTDALPALMAGNGCVLKPATTTPFTALWAVELLIEAGVPAGLVQVVTGRGSTLGSAIISSCDFVTFTGSTEVGRTVAAQAGDQLIGCALELGGKNAMIVRHDADLDRAVDSAVTGCFASAGQLCISLERIYVHASIRDEFTRRFVEQVGQLELSAALAYGADMGSLQSRSQLETVTRHVDDAVDKGVTVLTGGKPRPDVGPLFYAPTVLTDVTPEMEVHRAETFGPVVSIYGFETDEEALAQANDSAYGLNAAVFSRDARVARDLARRINAGTVNINETYAAAWGSVDAPMGGFKDSGLGRRHGREGIRKYTEVQNIAQQRLLPTAQLPLLNQEQSARALTAAIRILSRVPRIRSTRRG